MRLFNCKYRYSTIWPVDSKMQNTCLMTVLAISCVFFAVSGCGSSDDRGAKVSGSVKIGGQSQEGARVVFVPVGNSSGSQPGGAATKADGSFETHLKPGKYKVVVSRMVDKTGNVPGDSDDPTMDYTQLLESGFLRETIPPKYVSVDSTPLLADIPPEGKTLEPFSIE